MLGYLILEAPSGQARVTVAREVASCANSEDMLDLGKVYFNHYIHACMPPLVVFSFAHTPRTSQKKVRNKGGPHWHAGILFFVLRSRRPFEFETTEETMMGMAVEAPQDHRSAKNSVSPISCLWYRRHIREPDRNFFPGFGSGRFSLRRLSGYNDCASVKNSRELQRQSLPQIFIHSLRPYL
jgi:hypothetical protein